MSDRQQQKKKKKGRKGRGRGHRELESVSTVPERPGGLQSSSDDSREQGAVGGSKSKDVGATPEDLSSLSLQGACAYDDASTVDISEVEVTVAPTPVHVPTHQPSRPDREVVSRDLQLLTNHYPIEFDRYATAYKYDVQFFDASGVSIDSKDIHKNTCITAFKYIIEHNEKFRTKAPIFDERKFLITARKLEDDEVRYTVPLKEPRNRPIASVYFNYATTADLHRLDEFREGRITERPIDEKQILEIILKYRKLSNQTKVGQSFFADGGRSLTTVDVVLDVKEGFYVSVASSCIGSTLNVDADYRAFVKEELAGKCCTELATLVLNDLRPNRRDSDRGGRGGWRGGAGRGRNDGGRPGRFSPGGEMRSLSDLLDERPVISHEEGKSLQTLFKGLKVYSDHLSTRRSYTLTGISGRACSEITFKDEKQNEIKLVDYYKDKYGIRLKYTALPALALSRGRFLPMEICGVIGVQVRNNLSEKAKAMLIRKVGEISAIDRKKSIDQWVHHSAEQHDPVLRAYGIKIRKEMIKLMGDVLKPPELQGRGNQKLVFNDDGTWHFGRDKKILQGKRITNWTVIGIVRDDSVLEKFGSDIKKCADFIGVDMKPIEERRSIRSVYGRRESLSKELQLLKEKGMEVVFVVLDPRSDYGLLKWLANSQIGIVTQGIKSTNVGRNWRDATGRNILLKLNTKMDGVNYQINREILPKELQSGVMLMGADVTHPSPGDDSCLPSIAAVIGSMDDTFMRYSDDIKLQVHQKATKDSVEEMIYLQESCQELLIRYRNRNRGRFPKRIIFFRDGVSDGQFEMVQNREIPAIKRACIESGAGDIPLSMIISKKRGHTRFFCCHHQDARGKTRNVPGGTVVSTEVVSPLHLNWYGVSHQSLAGVSKPTHYTVLSDESQLSPSTLMSFTYFLCFCYGLCSRPVSIPTPVYYAHKAALTYRAYLSNVPELQKELRLTGCGSNSDARETNLKLRRLEKKILVHPDIRRDAPQYFLGPK